MHDVATAQAKADAIPRYEEPVASAFEWDEVTTCYNCGHFFGLSDRQCTMVALKMTPYGRWQKHRKEVLKDVKQAMKCFGVCEVQAGLVEGVGFPCEHYKDKADFED